MFLIGLLRKTQTNNIFLKEKLLKQSFQEPATDFKLPGPISKGIFQDSNI